MTLLLSERPVSDLFYKDHVHVASIGSKMYTYAISFLTLTIIVSGGTKKVVPAMYMLMNKSICYVQYQRRKQVVYEGPGKLVCDC